MIATCDMGSDLQKCRKDLDSEIPSYLYQFCLVQCKVRQETPGTIDLSCGSWVICDGEDGIRTVGTAGVERR